MSLITSRLILTFLTDPRHSSSNVHSSFLSIGAGFRRAAVCENMIGVLPFRLMFLDRVAGASASDPAFLLMLRKRVLKSDEDEVVLIRLLVLDNEGVGVLLLLLKLFDSNERRKKKLSSTLRL